jgi:hypothetical protein
VSPISKIRLLQADRPKPQINIASLTPSQSKFAKLPFDEMPLPNLTPIVKRIKAIPKFVGEKQSSPLNMALRIK